MNIENASSPHLYLLSIICLSTCPLAIIWCQEINSTLPLNSSFHGTFYFSLCSVVIMHASEVSMQDYHHSNN